MQHFMDIMETFQKYHETFQGYCRDIPNNTKERFIDIIEAIQSNIVKFIMNMVEII